MPEALLEVRDLDLFYGDAQALSKVSLRVPEKCVVAVVGANGAGKTSLIRAIAGIERPAAGSIRFKGREIGGLESHAVCELGLGQVAEGRQIFPSMTVAETWKWAVCSSARAPPRNRRVKTSTCCFPGSGNA